MIHLAPQCIYTTYGNPTGLDNTILECVCISTCMYTLITGFEIPQNYNINWCICLHQIYYHLVFGHYVSSHLSLVNLLYTDFTVS